MIRKMMNFILLNTESEKSIQSTKKLVTLASFILMLCSAIMTAVNYINESLPMLTSTALLTVVFLVSFLICHKGYNKRAVGVLMGISIITLFSYFVVIGGNQGFAIDWILLVPVAYMTLFGLAGGLIVGGYFWVFLLVFLWTPVNDLLPFVYSQEVKLRFPIIYSCGFFLAILMEIKSKRLQIAQLQNEARLSEAVRKERNSVEEVSLNAVSSICRALDAKDTYTKEHSDHVASYACMIAGRLGWNEERIEKLRRAGKVHDLGKIGIPDNILKKEGDLSQEEYAVMRQHVALGARIVSDFSTMPELEMGAKYHHERYDGKGYSTGLSGEDIPIEGRIIALADAIDAMSSDRVYRRKRSGEYLVRELQAGAGIQFDPKLVKVALALIKEGMVELITGEEMPAL